MSRWGRTFDIRDVFHNDEIPMPERFALIAARVEALAPELATLAENMRAAEDADEFNDAWNEFYDWADYTRVWVRTR